jgi:peptidase S46-like protein
MAPEFDIAFFGGDPDNFEYPRYDLDISFFRAYENDKPAKTSDYLKWSKTGVKEGDLVFVSGHPGRTSRLLTMDQLEFLRDYQYPMLMAALDNRVAMLQKYGAISAENARQAESDLFGTQNSAKAYVGYNGGLQDKGLMDKKAAAEKILRAYANSDPKRQQEFGDPWGEISKAVGVQKEIYKPLFYLQGGADNDSNAAMAMGGFRGSLVGYARILVRVTSEREKPNGDRLRGYQDSMLPSLEQRLFSTAPVYKSLQQAQLAQSLAEMQEALGANNEAVKAALAGMSPGERAKQVIEGTQLQDVSLRKQLYDGGKAAVDASTDPLIVMMRTVDPYARAVRKRYDDDVDPVLRKNAGDIAKLRFAQGGFGVPPDATFTLRLSYGAVKGYELKGKPVPWFTTLGGAYEREAQHGGKPPYELPQSWIKAKSSLDLKIPLDTVSTPDIIGGNSGSPVINKDAEVVGIIFDGNIESLPWNFVYDDVVGRSVATDSRAIIEVLRKVYHADGLANELIGAPTGAGKSKAIKPATPQR